MKHGTIHTLPPYAILALIAILVGQSTWLYIDAYKRGHAHWLWGLLGLIQFPTPLVVYLIFARRIFRRTNHEK